MKTTAPAIGLVILAIAQLAALGNRLAPAPVVAVGDDLSAIRVSGADGTELPLVTGEAVLVLVFDPECVHSQRIAPEWRALLGDAREPANALAVSPGTHSSAREHAEASEWTFPVVTIDAGTLGSRAHALVSRTPWVFALDGDGRVLAEGHGSELPEVAKALTAAPSVSLAGWPGRPGGAGR